ncbi:MAG: hypothetical protein OYH77_00750 [Pseudomonadota bacterium]|nr:hypothetical protein [Pseudomonadota bacterium]
MVQLFASILVVIMMLSCASQDELMHPSSYQARDKNEYVYLLNHTAKLTADGHQQTIEDSNHKDYGQCFYKATSKTKLRLHRQSDLHKALENAVPLNSTYMPLDTIQATFKKNRTLQELYTSEMHWLLPSAGAFTMLIPIALIDSFLHRGNGMIIAKSQAEVMAKLADTDNSTRKQIYEALHLTAKSEHAADEFMRSFFAQGSKNPIRKLQTAIMDSKLSRGIAAIFKKGCVGKRAGVCLVAYLIGFNSLFVVAMPVGANEVSNTLARVINRESETNTLHNLLYDNQTLNKTQVTNKKVLAALEQEIRKWQANNDDAEQLSCPSAQELYKNL